MKAILIIATIVSMTAIHANDMSTVLSYNETEKAEKAYVQSLNYDNTGVVESAIYCTLQLKRSHPENALIFVRRVMDRLAKKGETPQIRFKANLVTMYLETPELVDRLDYVPAQDGPEFWETLVTNIYPSDQPEK